MDPIVNLPCGKVRGTTGKSLVGDEFFSFFGIPYAKPPIGERRFKAPSPIDPWNGIHDGSKEGPACPSKHMWSQLYIGREDNCLHVNVYTRRLPDTTNKGSSQRAVMVFFYGGAFVHGSNNTDFYGAEYLMSEDIVLVCVNYRTGIFGFLSLEDPSLGVPGNAGLKDQALALRWIQENIRYFGGDPKNVTIFGESAGGASVHYLCLSPMAKGLFHKAIIQSGSTFAPWAKGKSNGLATAKRMGHEDWDEKKILEHLKTLPPREIVKIQHRFVEKFNNNAMRTYCPVVEQNSNEPAFLTEEPLQLIKTGQFAHVPLMIGCTSNEGILFELVRLMSPSVSPTKLFEDEIHWELGLQQDSAISGELGAKIKKFYFNNNKVTSSDLENMYMLKTDTQFVYPAYRTIQYHKQQAKAPIYHYRMSIDTSINHFKAVCTSKWITLLGLLYTLVYIFRGTVVAKFFLKLAHWTPKKKIDGACHADDLSYLFKSFLGQNYGSTTIEGKSVRKVVKLWTNFAKTGNPTPEIDPLFDNVQWQPVSKENDCYLDIGIKLVMGADLYSERMKFWDSIHSYG